MPVRHARPETGGLLSLIPFAIAICCNRPRVTERLATEPHRIEQNIAPRFSHCTAACRVPWFNASAIEMSRSSSRSLLVNSSRA
jgi:hypothetical protein